MIRSRENRTYKWLRKLSRSARERRRCGKALLEGIRLVEASLRQGGCVSMLVLAAGACGRSEVKKILSRTSDVSVALLDEKLFRELSAFSSPSGVLAVIDLPRVRRGGEEADALFLDGVQDPGNLGMALRSAAASGTGTVFLSAQCADPWSPKVLRAGMGAHFALGIREERDLAAAAEGFGGEVIALDAGGRKSLYDLELRGRTGFVVGSEGSGVSPALLHLADQVVHIPMPGWREPLNAAAAASVCLFELVRQRLEE